MQPEEVPTEVLADVARAVETDVALVGRLAGGVNAGAVRVQVAGRADAVLKAVPRTDPRQLDEVLRAQRVVEHMRGRGYPTPAWLGVGATATHVWHLMDFVDAVPASELTVSLVEQLCEINDLQAGQASEPPDHWRYAWRVVTRRGATVAGLSAYSSAASGLVERLLLACADLGPPPGAPDMVHADLNPSNVLTRDGVVLAVVDIENAGSGTRATDLITLQWHTFRDPLNGVRHRLWTKALDLVGWDWVAALAATQVLLQLEWRVGLMRSEAVNEVIDRGHRAFDELDALR
ncbi:phosphotransferase family protein [Nocardioides sp.]|uniref:phosphotransferase family protein n=1 Tax=Nocardioides sp. TaxID=35761 RepID=UPI002721565B|nr:aminoglycoside phosphotransferase family protein [Nocardioides sp.]MDO9454511.1 aminoglycoside phosphotransferase family protein [Nocardioides sp.]